MPITYKRINKELTDLELAVPSFAFNCNTEKDCTIMRVQLCGKIEYDAESGARVSQTSQDSHNAKCKKILEMEQNNDNKSDIVLFPEYSISYDLLDELIGRKILPEINKLWCLPCQAIKNSDFKEKIQSYKNQGIIVIDKAFNDIKEKNFVNALIYLFITYSRDGQEKIIMVPQIKTQEMRDEFYECEAYMSKGNTIYIFGGQNESCLTSFLCADSLNNEIKWSDINDLGRSFIILHPQLNANSRNNDFCRLRREVFSSNNKQVYISCNWAEDTELKKYGTKGSSLIKESWSCIYYKYEKSSEMRLWYNKNIAILKENFLKFLYSGFMKNERVAVWYSSSKELAHKIILQKPFSNIPAIEISSIDVKADGAYIFNSTDWVVTMHTSYTWKSELEKLPTDYSELSNRISSDEKYFAHIFCNDKILLDRHLEKLLAKDEFDFAQIGSDEQILSPSLLMNEGTREHGKDALKKLYELVNLLKNNDFPKHLEHFKNNHKIILGQPYNLTMSRNHGSANNITISIAEDSESAEKYLKKIKKGNICFKDDISLLASYFCVFVKNLANPNKVQHFPSFNPSISEGERVRESGKITDGGKDDV